MTRKDKAAVRAAALASGKKWLKSQPKVSEPLQNKGGEGGK